MLRAMRRSLLVGLIAAGALWAQAPVNVPKGELLWAQGAPGALGAEEVDKPTLAPYVVPAGRGPWIGIM